MIRESKQRPGGPPGSFSNQRWEENLGRSLRHRFLDRLIGIAATAAYISPSFEASATQLSYARLAY